MHIPPLQQPRFYYLNCCSFPRPHSISFPHQTANKTKATDHSHATWPCDTLPKALLKFILRSRHYTMARKSRKIRNRTKLILRESPERILPEIVVASSIIDPIPSRQGFRHAQPSLDQERDLSVTQASDTNAVTSSSVKSMPMRPPSFFRQLKENTPLPSFRETFGEALKAVESASENVRSNPDAVHREVNSFGAKNSSSRSWKHSRDVQSK